MSKRIANVVLFLAVVGAGSAMTVYVGKGAKGMLIYNFAFLGVMVAIYLAGMILGMFKLNRIAQALLQGTEELIGIFKTPGRTKSDNLSYLEGIFSHKYLDGKMENFVTAIGNSKEGIGDIEEYISEEEIDLHIHKRLLEMVPDILTSLGILGTFVGLVWGLKNFEPSNYELMTYSMASLVEGIKVAFLTSIYGISLSIVYTIGMKSEYSAMTERLQAFLEKFHAFVLPTAENESRNLLLSSQKLQTKAMKQMAEQFSVQMADSFEKVITPTFKKMNDSLDVLVGSVTRCQKDAIQDIVDTFLEQMNQSFSMEFRNFNEALEQLKKAQKENTDYTSALYKSMSQQLGESYIRQDKAMKDLVAELGTNQSRYMSAVTKITQENQEIQKMQQQDYQRISEYLKEAEKSSAKFWVACNQTMQKYVETAAASMEKASATSQVSGDLLKANKRVVEEFNVKMQEFVEYQRLSYKTMDQVRRLLTEVTAEKDNGQIRFTTGDSKENTTDSLEKVLEEQSARQEALLEEMSRNIRDLSKAAQKNKFSFFK